MTASRASILGLFSASLLAAGIATAQLPEPETVFYGRIVNRTGGLEYQLTSGTVTWTISSPGGAPLTVTGTLGALQDGKYSYLLKVPHQAKALDLSLAGGSLPLKPSDEEFAATSILVNGRPASPIGVLSTFVASQPKRGGVHRMDLEVFDDIEDSDGDGIPDWWEDKYGLDKQLASDARLRFGSNRYTYLEAYRLGLDPRQDDRLPQLLTTELTVQGEGSTGLLLRAIASSAAPEQIVYRLVEVPAGGALVLRNSRPDPKLASRTLGAGDLFTQAAVQAGLVEFVHRDPAVRAAKLKVQISVAGRTAEAVPGEVTLNVYQPAPIEGRASVALASGNVAVEKAGATSAAELWKKRATRAFASEWAAAELRKDDIAAFLLARWFGFTVWDGREELPSQHLTVPSAGLTAKEYAANYVPRFGRARSHVLFAGRGAIRLQGGMSGDVLVAGSGNTALRGNGGPDFFVAGRAETTIEDFSPSQRDVLDVSALLDGAPGPLADRIQVTTSAGTSYLTIPLGGDRSATIVLRDLTVAPQDLAKWQRTGLLFTGDVSNGTGPQNQAPVAVADEAFVIDGEPVTVPVLGNDTDPDGDALEIVSVIQGQRGTVEIVGSSVIYTPNPGFEGRDEFSYTVGDGQGALSTAKVVVTYPYPAAAGTYIELVQSPDGLIGQVVIALQPSGAFTVKFLSGGLTYVGRGQFDASGLGEAVVRSGSRTLTVKLHMDLADPNFPLGGTIEGPFGTTAIPETVATGKRTTDLSRYTFALHMPAGEPAAHGFATANVARNAAVRIVGQAADGTPFAASAPQRVNGTVAWYTSLYRRQGWIIGRWNLATGPNGQVGGTTQWTRLSDGKTPAFQHALPTEGSIYTPPSVPTVSVLQFGAEITRLALATFSGGGLLSDVTATLTFGTADAIKADSNTIRLQLVRSTGLINGQLTVDGKPRTVRGVVLQTQNRGYGYFRNGTVSGALEIVPQ